MIEWVVGCGLKGRPGFPNTPVTEGNTWKASIEGMVSYSRLTCRHLGLIITTFISCTFTTCQAQLYVLPLLHLGLYWQSCEVNILSSFYTEEMEALEDYVASRFKSVSFSIWYCSTLQTQPQVFIVPSIKRWSLLSTPWKWGDSQLALANEVQKKWCGSLRGLISSFPLGIPAAEPCDKPERASWRIRDYIV